MYLSKMSYYTKLVALLLAIMSVVITQASAADIYLDPDSLFFTGAVGDEFDMNLEVSSSISGLRLYQIYINFDPTILDTVSTGLGDLFATSGFGTFFKTAIVTNDGNGDTYLRVEALLLGPTAVVDGPGTLANLRFKIIGTGFADMSIVSHVLTDISNDTIPNTTAEGAAVFSDAPPFDFSLISPIDGLEISLLPNDSAALTWELTTSPYIGDNISYTLELSKTTSFELDSTEIFTGLTDTVFYRKASDLRNGFYYWRVTATGNIYGFETVADANWFDYSNSAIDPTQFNLLYPIDNDSVSGLPGESFDLSWSPSDAITDGEGVIYTLEYGQSDLFEPAETITLDGLTDTFHTLYIDDLTPGVYYWRVTAIGDVYGGITASTPFPTDFRFYYEAVEPDPFELYMPANNIKINTNNKTEITFYWETPASIIPNDTLNYTLYMGPVASFPGTETITETVSDISQLNLPVSQFPLGLEMFWQIKAVNRFDMERWSTSIFSVLFYYRGDFNIDGIIDVEDLVALVDYSFRDGDAPEIMETVDLNCDTIVDIEDVVFLVDYSFRSGDFPGCDY